MVTETLEQCHERLCDSLNNPVLAIFCMCAVYDVKFDAECADDSWEGYTAAVTGTFADGTTSIQTALFSGMSQREQWDSMWGEDRNDGDCKKLDEYRRIYLAQLDSIGGMVDPQQEEAARQCALMAMEKENNLKLVSSPQMKADEKVKLTSVIKTLDETIRKNLADCNMRKADIMPSQKQRLDGIIDALRKKYGVGMDMTYDQAMGAFYQWCRERKHPQTVDAEEHALLAILKTMQKNDDLPEPTELPNSMRLTAFSDEFAPEPNEEEEEAYAYLGIVHENTGVF